MLGDNDRDGFDDLSLDVQTKIILYYIDKALKKDGCNSKPGVKHDKDDHRDL